MPSIGLFSVASRLDGISSLTNSIIYPPLESQSEQYGVLKPSIKKFPIGKISSSLVTEIIKTSIFPLTFSLNNSSLFRIEFIIFKQEMPSRQQKSAKKDSERYLMFGPNHVLVTLRWDGGRPPGHENVCRWFLKKCK